MHNLWTLFLYQPLYNVLILLTKIIPTGDVGLSIIVLTILVKLVLQPLTKKSIQSQVALARIQPEIERIKKDFPNKEEQAKKTMEVYKNQPTSPFAGCVVLFIQIPIIFALYYVFLHGFTNDELLYPFIHASATLNMLFVGLVDITKPNLIFAILAGVSQFLQLRVSLQNQTPQGGGAQSGTMKLMQSQMQYILPVMIIWIGTRLSGAVALYWITSNLVGAIQEYYIRKKLAGAPLVAVQS